MTHKRPGRTAKVKRQERVTPTLKHKELPQVIHEAGHCACGEYHLWYEVPGK